MSHPILDSTLHDLLEHDFDASPVAASGFGLTDYDEKLDDLSADAFHQRDADAAPLPRQARADRGHRAGRAAPDHRRRIDRDLASAVLRGRQILAPFEGWKRDPVTYSGPVTSGLFGLFLQRLRPEADLVDAAIARLGQVERVVEAGIANLDPELAHPLIVERGMHAARGGIRYVRDLLWLDVADPTRQANVRRRGPPRRGTSSTGRRTSTTLRGRARGTWVFGEERYSRSSRSARRCATTREACASSARPSSTGSTPR